LHGQQLFFLVNRRLLVSAIGEVFVLRALLSGIALSPELLGQYGRLSKNRDPVSVLRIGTSRSLASRPSPASHVLHPLAPICYVLPLAGTLSATSAGTLLPLTIAVTSTPNWLSWLGYSPRPPPARAIHSTVAKLALGYAVSCYSTTSLAQGKVRSIADFTGQSAHDKAFPLSR